MFMPIIRGHSNNILSTTRRRASERKIGARYLLLALGLGISAVLASGMYTFVSQQGYSQAIEKATLDAGQIVEITGGFVRTYSRYGAKLPAGSMPTPASFRADALRHMEQTASQSNTLMTGVLGLPGREIAQIAKDEITRNQLLELEASRSTAKLATVIDQNSKKMHQSVWAFYANEQTCADCHNRLQNLSGDDQWQVGDLMGAQIVKRDITASLESVRRHAIVQAVLLFIAVYAAWVSCLYLLNHFRLNRQLRILASTDSLTGCINRREFQSRINELKSVTNGALLMLDLDKFKSINDSFGHDAGDAVIRDFSQRLRDHVREQDCVVRFGGEEFVIWLPDIKTVDAIQMAERVRLNVENAEVVTAHSTVRYTVSIGLTVVKNDSPKRLESWIKSADALLYRAKNDGRNRLVCGVC